MKIGRFFYANFYGFTKFLREYKLYASLRRVYSDPDILKAKRMLFEHTFFNKKGQIEKDPSGILVTFTTLFDNIDPGEWLRDKYNCTSHQPAIFVDYVPAPVTKAKKAQKKWNELA